VACAAIIVAGAFTTCFAFAESLDTMLYLALGQGFGFGVLHAFATVNQSIDYFMVLAVVCRLESD
jgi:hypothetical protein